MLLVIVGVLVANLRDRIIELFVLQGVLDEGEDRTPPNVELSETDLLSYLEFLAARQQLLWFIFGAIAVVLLIIAAAWLSWRFAVYRITLDAVESRSGVLFKQHRRAPLERIQSVNLQRSLLARVFGLTEVQVQTGGQGGTVELKYLGHAEAQRVRALILQAQQRVQQQVALQSERVSESASSAEPVASTAVDYAGRPYAPGGRTIDTHLHQMIDFDINPEARQSGTLISVGLGRLLGSIVLSTEVFVVLLLMVANVSAGVWLSRESLVGVVVLSIILLSVLISQFNKGFNFVLSRADDGVRVGAGFTSTTTETIPFGRIHAVEASQPLGWRPFGWYRVRIITAGHSVSEAGQNKLMNVVLPVGTAEDVAHVFETLLHGEADGAQERAESLLQTLRGGGQGFIGAAPFGALVLWFGTKRAGLQVGTTVRIRRGWVNRELIEMPLLKAQSVQLARPLVHRFAGMASITVHTVLGPFIVRMRGLDYAVANKVFDEIAHTMVSVQQAEATSPTFEPDSHGHETGESVTSSSERTPRT